MPKQILIAQLDQEIRDAERRSTFWNEQARLQADTDFAPTVIALAKGADLTLQQLRTAREVLEHA